MKDKYERLACLNYPYDAQSLIDHCDDDKIDEDEDEK